MHINYAQQRTGYLLANPSRFTEIGFDKDIAPLDFSQLKYLKDIVQFLKSGKIYANQLHSTQITELTQLVHQQGDKGYWRQIATNINANGSQLFPEKSLAKFADKVARVLEIPPQYCTVISTTIAFFALQMDEVDFKGYENIARLTLGRMCWVIEKKKADIQRYVIVNSMLERQILWHKRMLGNPLHKEKATVHKNINQQPDLDLGREIDNFEREKTEQQIRLANL